MSDIPSFKAKSNYSFDVEDDDEKPVISTLIRPCAIYTYDPERNTQTFSYEDLAVLPHGKSPKNDWIYRIRRDAKGVWRSVSPKDRDGGLVCFVREDTPALFEIFHQNKKLLIKVVKILNNAVVGVLVVGE